MQVHTNSWGWPVSGREQFSEFLIQKKTGKPVLFFHSKSGELHVYYIFCQNHMHIYRSVANIEQETLESDIKQIGLLKWVHNIRRAM